MSTAAKATGYLELEISGFDQALKTAKNLMVTFAAGFAAYKITDFFKDGIKDAITFGKEMQATGRAMGGFDPGKMLLAQKALEKAGMGAEEARGHIGDFISEGRKVSELFGGSENYAKALKDAAKDYGAQAAVLTRSGEKLQTVWNTMEAIGSKVRTFFMTLTEQFVGPLQVALDYLNQTDLAGVGTSFGKAISDAATTLFGIFKNGDMFTVLQLGVTLAFQESVNWLIGGFNFVAEYAEAALYNSVTSAFGESIDFLRGVANQWLSSDLVMGVANGFIAAWAHIYKKYTAGIAEVIEYMRAGIIYGIVAAVKTAIDTVKTIISKDFWASMWDGFKSFSVKVKDGMIGAFQSAMEFLKNGLPWAFQKAIEGMKSLFTKGGGTISELYNAKSFEDIKNSSLVRADSARWVSGKFGEVEDSSMKKAQPAIDKIKDFFTSVGTEMKATFKKGTIFDTSKDSDALKKLIEAGDATGKAMVLAAQKENNNDAPKNVLTQFSGSSSKVIADSLAKVGGGGGYLRAGMSLEAKTAIQQLQAQNATKDATVALLKETKENKPKQALMAR